MSELRKDPIIGQWVIVYTDESWKPERYDREDQTPVHAATCQFCPGRERQTPPEVDAIRAPGSKPNAPGWLGRVVPNKFPALKIEGGIDPASRGLFDMLNGVGAHEVLIETPDHNKNFADYSLEEIGHVITLYQNRIRDLSGDARFKYIIVFKNFGESAGTSVEHAHSQIIALPMIPKYVAQEIEGAVRYFDQHKRCIFCDIMEQERKDRARIVMENEHFMVFCPYVSRYAFESWIMPKRHGFLFTDVSGAQAKDLAQAMKEALLRMKICLSDPSFNFYIHSAPVNSEDPKAFHWHIEIAPRLTRTTGFEWGTGFYVVRTSPEAAANYLREAVTATVA